MAEKMPASKGSVPAVRGEILNRLSGGAEGNNA